LPPSFGPRLVLRAPCADTLKDREHCPCVGVSAASEEAWSPGSESRTGPLDFRVSPDFRASVSLRPVDVPAKSVIGQGPKPARLCGIIPGPVGKSVDICGRTKFAQADQDVALSTGKGVRRCACRAF